MRARDNSVALTNKTSCNYTADISAGQMPIQRLGRWPAQHWASTETENADGYSRLQFIRGPNQRPSPTHMARWKPSALYPVEQE